MKLRVVALSTVLLFSTGAFAQNNASATAPDTGSSMSTTQNGTANNGGAMQATPPIDSTSNTRPMDYGYRHRNGGGWSWGWIGLFGLFGLLGMGGRRRNRDAMVHPTNVPR